VRKTYATLALLASLATSSACTSAPPPAKPDADPNTISPTCGSEMNVHGKGYNLEARNCLWEAYQNAKTASLAITIHTVEGDPIKYLIDVHNKDDIDVTIDSHDHFGPHGVRHTKCGSITKFLSPQGRFGFTFQGCKDGPTELTIR
jgi:hypothetical protein